MTESHPARNLKHGPESDSFYTVLHGKHTSVVLETQSGEAPLWRYWGPRLPDDCVPLALLRESRAVPPSTMDFDQPLSVVPTFGLGWYGQSALLCHRAGCDFAQSFTRFRTTTSDPQRNVSIWLDDDVAHLRLVLRISLDDDDVLRLDSELTNHGSEVLEVAWLAAGTLPLPPNTDHVRSYYGQWATEFQLQVDALSRSLWARENRRGRTSHDCFPGAVVTTPGATYDSGTVYGAHLAWSGNHRQVIEWLDDGRYQWQLGEWLAPGEVRLSAGESVKTPALLASCSLAGYNGLAANFHAAGRAAISWPSGKPRPRPVHLNTWEAVYFEHEQRDITALAEAAAELGIERFVLDDGWFHHRDSDRSALGDWWPDKTKYPSGLLPLAEHVQSLGMEFGLWVEPEMVNPDSDLFRAHPDWVARVAGRPLLTMRNQLVLDVSRADVAEYLFEKLDELLGTTPIRYLKWDMNRDLTTAADRAGHAAYRKIVHAVYALLDRIRDAHPHVEIESCASGGGRMDFGVLQRTHRMWTSDSNDALSRLSIQRGALQFFPPEVLGAHIGSAPAHTTGRTQSLPFRAAVALPGHLGVEMDVRRLDEPDRAELKQWIDLYKSLRDVTHGTRVWLGEVGQGVVWQAHGDAAAQELIVFVYRTEPTTQRYTSPLCLPMLDAHSHYRVSRIDYTAPEWMSSPLNNDMLKRTENGESASPVVAHGAWLARSGLPLPRMLPETALIYRLVADSDAGKTT